MVCLVTFLVLHFGVLNGSWGRELMNEEVTDETLAGQWLDELNINMAKVLSETVQASWNFNTNITEENDLLAVNLELRPKMRFPYYMYITEVVILFCN